MGSLRVALPPSVEFDSKLICGSYIPNWGLTNQYCLVVEPTHLKNMLVKMGSSSPRIGVNIKEQLNLKPAPRKQYAGDMMITIDAWWKFGLHDAVFFFLLELFADWTCAVSQCWRTICQENVHISDCFHVKKMWIIDDTCRFTKQTPYWRL